MSVIIKNMKMPKTCCECEWHEYYGGDYDWCHACRMTGSMPIEYSVAELGRADDCPLVALPEKHGRLGDLDALRRELIAGHDLVGAKYVQMADTVIEAEGE